MKLFNFKAKYILMEDEILENLKTINYEYVVFNYIFNNIRNIIYRQISFSIEYEIYIRLN